MSLAGTRGVGARDDPRRPLSAYEESADAVDALLFTVTRPRPSSTEPAADQANAEDAVGGTSLRMTRPGWDFFALQPAGRSFAGPPYVVAHAAGDEIGMFTVVTRIADPAADGSRVVVVVENTGSAPLPIVPPSLVLRTFDGEQRDVAADEVAWRDGAACGERTLAPGESATSTVGFAVTDQFAQLRYAPSVDVAVTVGDATTGSAGSGSRPMIRIVR